MSICKKTDFAQMKIFFAYLVIQMKISRCMMNYGERIITMPAINSVLNVF